MMGARQKVEDSVGLEVVVRVIDVLTESETWLSRTGGIGRLSGSDIVLSGPTEGEERDEQYQQVATHRHCSALILNKSIHIMQQHISSQDLF